MNKAIGDSKLCPGYATMAPHGESRWLSRYVADSKLAPLRQNWQKNDVIHKPQNPKYITYCTHSYSGTESWPRVTRTENFCGVGSCSFWDMWANRLTDRPTGIQTHSSQYFAPFRGQSNNKGVITGQRIVNSRAMVGTHPGVHPLLNAPICNSCSVLCGQDRHKWRFL